MKTKVAAWLILVVVVAACASAPPAKAVKSVNEVAGTWEGTVAGPGGSFPIRNMVVKPDGSWELELVGGNPARHRGSVQLVDGTLRGRSETTGNSSTWTLHEGDGKRVLKVVNDDGRVTGEFRPVTR